MYKVMYANIINNIEVRTFGSHSEALRFAHQAHELGYYWVRLEGNGEKNIYFN